jgi:hypothetical protein
VTDKTTNKVFSNAASWLVLNNVGAKSVEDFKKLDSVHLLSHLYDIPVDDVAKELVEYKKYLKPFAIVDSYPVHGEHSKPR